jgi:ABC-type glutathione transport system ATPase component
VGARESGFTERPSRTADSRGNTIRHDATLPPDAPSSAEVLRVRGLSKEFRTGWFRRTAKSVLQDVEFALRAGERLGIMGPSGQGKTTLARILLGLLPPTEGSVQLAVDRQWLEVSHARHSERSRWRQRIQMLYQDSDLVLDPASSIADSLVEAYHVFQPRLSKHACQRLAVRLLEELALPASVLDAFPYRLSGGERKRVALARALAALGCPFPAGPNDPWRVLVLDEPTAGVDVVLQAILGQFLLWVQPRLRLCYLVISHDELFVARFCHRARRLVNGRLISDNDQPMEFDHAESRL